MLSDSDAEVYPGEGDSEWFECWLGVIWSVFGCFRVMLRVLGDSRVILGDLGCGV
jgi:hypothetical protein